MKKYFSLLWILCLSICLCSGFSVKDSTKENSLATTIDTTSTTDIAIGCLKGPTAIGMIKLLSDSENGHSLNHYTYTIAGAAEELTAGFLNGSLDIAAIPCNLASILYHKTNGEIITAAINTLGVLYVVETGDSIHSVSDLKGKTIYSTGQGTTPEYTLRYLLHSYGLNPDTDVTIEYKSEATEIAALLSQTESAIAILPQPYTTIALNQNKSLRIALDITNEWEAQNDSTIVTGVLAVRKSFIEEQPQAWANFLTEYEASTRYASDSIEETAVLLEQFDIFNAAIATQAIPYCHITYETGEKMQELVTAYLSILYEQNPASVGGKLPEEEMFYLESQNTD